MNIIKAVFPYVVIVLGVIFVRTYIITPVRVMGESMVPTLEDKQILLLKKYDKKIERFDIVIVDYQDTKLVKRVIGLPLESIRYEANQLYINNQLLKDVSLDQQTADFDLKDLGYDVIPEGCYFVMGDNRKNSTDSRILGPICEKDIVGTASFRLYPFNQFGSISLKK